MRPEATAGSAPLQITNAQPQSAWLASAAAIILWVPAGMTASTLLIAGRNGRERDQSLRQAPPESAVCQGRLGEDNDARGKGRRTSVGNHLANVLPPVG